MNLFKDALSPFVSFDETKPNETTQKAMKSAKEGDTVKEAPKVAPNIGKFQNYFTELMEKLDLPGPDYFEFSKAIQDLESDLPNEDARIKVAFKSMKSSGLTKEILLSSAQSYLTQIEADKQDFTKKVSEKENEEIESRKKEIGSLESSNKSIEDQIATLEKQKQDNLGKIETLRGEIQTSEQKIHNNEAGYNLAYNEIVGKINTIVKKIQTIL